MGLLESALPGRGHRGCPGAGRVSCRSIPADGSIWPFRSSFAGRPVCVVDVPRKHAIAIGLCLPALTGRPLRARGVFREFATDTGFGHSTGYPLFGCNAISPDGAMSVCGGTFGLGDTSLHVATRLFLPEFRRLNSYGGPIRL
jgi:hypothetical protein